MGNGARSKRDWEPSFLAAIALIRVGDAGVLNVFARMQTLDDILETVLPRVTRSKIVSPQGVALRGFGRNGENGRNRPASDDDVDDAVRHHDHALGRLAV